MRILSVLVLVCLAAGGLALVAPEYRDRCYTDQQCKQQLGSDCICLKVPQQPQRLGNCYCNSGSGFYYGCSHDFECQFLGKPGQACSCRKGEKQARGHCVCDGPLY